MMEKYRKTNQADLGCASCSRVDNEARALSRIYKRAIERCEQAYTADESPAGSNATIVERGDSPGEVHPAREGGGRHATKD